MGCLSSKPPPSSTSSSSSSLTKKRSSKIILSEMQNSKTKNSRITTTPSIKYTFKYILVGGSGAGKSCLLHQFMNNEFINTRATIGVELASKQINIEGDFIRLQIWDTAGQEKYHSITPKYFRNAVGCLLMYDTNDRKSFDVEVPFWLRQLREHCPESIVVTLVGTKIDMKSRVVRTEEGAAFAKKNGLHFIECSAKENVQVLEAFFQTATEIYTMVENGDVSLPVLLGEE